MASVTPESARLRAVFKIYEQAEQDIIDILSYKQANGYVDYPQSRALERIQTVLNELDMRLSKAIPVLVRSQYLMGKHSVTGAAKGLGLIDNGIVENLVRSNLSTAIEASVVVERALNERWRQAIIKASNYTEMGRQANMIVARVEASGEHISMAQAIFLEEMENKGVTAFIDKSGRQWSIRTYGQMITRTVARQATNLGTITARDEHDLYQISSHNSNCPICAPLEGRVYSRSGNNPNYPPLTYAFGKIDPEGSDTLDNSWLNIHPNCLHVLNVYIEANHSAEDVEKVREFSSYSDNPPSSDSRSAAQIKAWHERQASRRRLLDAQKQWERYRLVLGSNVPKTFQNFLKHKVANTEKYQQWAKSYREQNKSLRQMT